MALTAEVIKSNESLAGLTEQQLTTIAQLSANDEVQVINSKIGELHGRYEADILTVSGIPKNQGEKAYDYNKRVITEFKAKVEGGSELQKQMEASKTKISELEKAIAEGKGNDQMAQKLRDTESQLTQLKTQFEAEKTNWDKEKTEFSTKITSIQVETELEKSVAGLKFKAQFPDAVQEILLKNAKSEVLGKYKPDWVEADGKRIMVFRDGKGEIVRNVANGLNPFTAKELIEAQLKDAIEIGKSGTGAGTMQQGKGKTDVVELVDISGAKTRVEADEMIEKYLLGKGILRTSQDFVQQKTKLRSELGVQKLPLL